MANHSCILKLWGLWINLETAPNLKTLHPSAGGGQALLYRDRPETTSPVWTSPRWWETQTDTGSPLGSSSSHFSTPSEASCGTSTPQSCPSSYSTTQSTWPACWKPSSQNVWRQNLWVMPMSSDRSIPGTHFSKRKRTCWSEESCHTISWSVFGDTSNLTKKSSLLWSTCSCTWASAMPMIGMRTVKSRVFASRGSWPRKSQMIQTWISVLMHQHIGDETREEKKRGTRDSPPQRLYLGPRASFSLPQAPAPRAVPNKASAEEREYRRYKKKSKNTSVPRRQVFGLWAPSGAIPQWADWLTSRLLFKSSWRQLFFKICVLVFWGHARPGKHQMA